MIRAAAKNHASVTVVVDPDDYAAVLAEMAAHGGATSLELRKALAAKAYARTAAYDAAIAAGSPTSSASARRRWRAVRRPAGAGAALRREPAPDGRLLRDRRAAPRRRHGRAAPGQGAVLQQPQRHRRRLRAGRRVRSEDLARRRHHQARQPVRRRARPTLREAYAKALRCDPVSAFGGIIALNRPIDAATARDDHRHLHRGGRSPPTRPTRPRPSSPRRRTCAC